MRCGQSELLSVTSFGPQNMLPTHVGGGLRCPRMFPRDLEPLPASLLVPGACRGLLCRGEALILPGPGSASVTVQASRQGPWPPILTGGETEA